jgi:hypothetical protein
LVLDSLSGPAKNYLKKNSQVLGQNADELLDIVTGVSFGKVTQI